MPTLTFETYSPAQHGLEGIYQIGATEAHPDGVAREMAAAFDFKLADRPNAANLGDLIAAIGPAKELQNNVGLVQQRLGTGQSAIELAQRWVNDSGLLVPVDRTFMTNEPGSDIPVNIGYMSLAVARWSRRRANRLVALMSERPKFPVVIAAGTREMSPSEYDDVGANMTEIDYMDEVIVPLLGRQGVKDIKVVRVNSTKGSEIAAVAARRANDIEDLQDPRTAVAVVSNAGVWPENTDQFRRGARADTHDLFDQNGRQLVVVSDPIYLGTGTESANTHQDPFAALGLIIRGLRAFALHAEG